MTATGAGTWPPLIHRAAVDFDTPQIRAASRTEPPGTAIVEGSLRGVYYRCTGFHGACGNTYIREEKLANLLGTVITPIQITREIADDIARALRSEEADDGHRRQSTISGLDRHRQDVSGKLDRGYDDFVSGKISENFWTR
jgi:hypothetical protein